MDKLKRKTSFELWSFELRPKTLSELRPNIHQSPSSLSLLTRPISTGKYFNNRGLNII